MGLIEDCNLYYKTKNLYEVLNVQRTANDQQLKKAYRLKSLTVHPDRVEDEFKEEATKKFQILSKIYFILSDKDRRSVYDETGEIDDENDELPERDWSDYWRLLFPKITIEDIKEYEKKYIGSNEETEDLITYYEQFEGDMDNISECLPFYDVNEEPRYKSIINELIKKKEIPAFKNFTHEPKKKQNERRKRYASEAVEAEEAAKSMNLQESSLEKAILSRNANREQNFNSLLDSLEAKYAKPSAKNSKKGKKKA